MLNYYRIETCQQDVDAWLPVGIYGDTLGVLKTLAEHVWTKDPNHRPHVRIIREGAERPVLVWSGGKFRRNWLGKWQLRLTEMKMVGDAIKVLTIDQDKSG